MQKDHNGQVDKVNSESKMLHIFDIICWPLLKLSYYLLPVNKLPELAFLMIVTMFFVSIDFILTVLNVLSVYTQLSHIFLGLTLIAWGASPIELINLMIAAKKNQL